ncbi:hypothetical protein K933_09953 [Candidatus Halobonum tyrrellensis G22]|uniref:Uncharacterized protein n=1 Tax=Candidatus Halobonum tyrrellensis G22 TaxID=1324957 RepID=V4HDR0_9EURY|nr:hypothetical protein K933_09953 [Candidatus Halobonum tyrrellensis G22]
MVRVTTRVTPEPIRFLESPPDVFDPTHSKEELYVARIVYIHTVPSGPRYQRLALLVHATLRRLERLRSCFDRSPRCILRFLHRLVYECGDVGRTESHPVAPPERLMMLSAAKNGCSPYSPKT